MHSFDFDLFTIGAGSGGVAASRRAGALGARVAICEEARVGGTCVLRGCVPKKLLMYGAHYAEDLHDAAGYGWQIPQASLDWATLIERKNKELDRLNGIYQQMLKDGHVTSIAGRGILLDPHTVQVGDKTYTAKNILISTGSWPVMPEIPGIQHAITSNEALELTPLPRHLIVIGGGYIGVEFSGIYRAAGAQVTLLVRDDDILKGFDQEVREHLHAEMVKKGITIRRHSRVVAIEGDNHTPTEGHAGQKTVVLDDGTRIEGDQMLFAVGRRANTRGLGLETVGIHPNARGAIPVDAFSQTVVPSIYAVGDVTDRMNLTPVAIAEARALVETLFRHNPTTVDYHDVPTAVFSMPPVGTVGLSEAEALLRGHAIEVYGAKFRPMKHTLGGSQERTLMKLVVDKASQRVLGVHMVGSDAPEIIQAVAIAVKCGATKSQFDATMAVHPTAAEEFVLMRTPRAHT